MSITRFNKGGNGENLYFVYDREKSRPYTNLESLYKLNGKDKVYKVLGLYVNEGKFGEQGSAVLEDVQVNLPKHLVPVIKEIRSDEKLVSDINAGLVGFKIYEYISKKYNVKAYSIRWVDIEPADFTEVDTDDMPF